MRRAYLLAGMAGVAVVAAAVPVRDRACPPSPPSSRPQERPAEPPTSRPAADRAGGAVQQRRRLLPARRHGRGQRPRRSVLPRAGHQRPAQEHGAARPRRRPHLHRLLRLQRPRRDAPSSRFAINLTGNPTFGSILNQARGEKVEVVLQQTNATQPGTLTGTIVGIEKQKQAGRQGRPSRCELLNLWCADGMRSVKLTEVQRVRFLNPVMDSEFQKALETLALSHDTQKKAVSINFAGEGKRKVRVGYVIENPIWKTSYRLVLDKDRRSRTCKAGPWSRTPPTRTGRTSAWPWSPAGPSPSRWTSTPRSTSPGPPSSRNCSPRCGPPPTAAACSRTDATAPAIACRRWHRAETTLDGKQADGAGGAEASPTAGRAAAASPAHRRAGDSEAAGRAHGPGPRACAVGGDGGEAGRLLPVRDRQAGDACRARSRPCCPSSARTSRARASRIYNERTQAKFPLLGLKFKNTSGLHLMQGPITVFEGSNYAGDARILDLQPNEERLLSYAVDLGTEVNPVPVAATTAASSRSRRSRASSTPTTKVRETQDLHHQEPQRRRSGSC